MVRAISPSENKHSFATFFPNYNTGQWEKVHIQLFKHDGPLLRAKYFLPSFQTYHLFVSFTYATETKHKLAWNIIKNFFHDYKKSNPATLSQSQNYKNEELYTSTLYFNSMKSFKAFHTSLNSVINANIVSPHPFITS